MVRDFEFLTMLLRTIPTLRSSRSVKSGQSQPDGGSNEQCIAILDIDFYGDGPHLHDIECNHRKPVICEN